ncbi:ABC transporter substrate-binding protein [Candidatus Neoehrlichia procyonis]|uniref:Toluene tolerance, Ttg2 family protein n=1 Tax=Candidatus Neoehrlichia procyonis str. RAC413 TaxID=1359163 RepID=A0A0F3NMQ0_9RICK|nr:ABC transporter substrate-binding protein [Candidatus Neoehrlichia lotoris]KJV69338.1 toluene tolerance, Ttg2 family protein [Candidatus Neoehrlichia lotoris str. RAC413]
MFINYRSYVAIFVLIFLVWANVHAGENTCSNYQQVCNFIEELQYFSSRIVKQAKDRASAYTMLQDMMHRSLNMKNIAKFVMGIYWKNSSLEQREKFISEYSKYIVRIYVKQLYIYASYDMDIFWVKKNTTNNYFVKTRLINQSNINDFVVVVFNVSYDDAFYIDDIKVNNMISIAMHQRSMVNNMIRERGLDKTISYFISENTKIA